jgi:hypothetical protein
VSLSRYVDVWCDAEDCAKWCEEATAKTALEARKLARQCGWVHRDGKDYCPHHAADRDGAA